MLKKKKEPPEFASPNLFANLGNLQCENGNLAHEGDLLLSRTQPSAEFSWHQVLWMGDSQVTFESIFYS